MVLHQIEHSIACTKLLMVILVEMSATELSICMQNTDTSTFSVMPHILSRQQGTAYLIPAVEVLDTCGILE